MRSRSRVVFYSFGRGRVVRRQSLSRMVGARPQNLPRCHLKPGHPNGRSRTELGTAGQRRREGRGEVGWGGAGQGEAGQSEAGQGGGRPGAGQGGAERFCQGIIFHFEICQIQRPAVPRAGRCGAGSAWRGGGAGRGRAGRNADASVRPSDNRPPYSPDDRKNPWAWRWKHE